jgi:hypothetical protein
MNPKHAVFNRRRGEEESLQRAVYDAFSAISQPIDPTPLLLFSC